MAGKKKKPVRGRPFNSKTGAAAGRKSSRRIPEELKGSRVKLKQDIEEAIYRYMDLPIKDLKGLKGDDALTTKESIIIKILLDAHEKGITANFNYCLERTIGKVKEEIDHTGSFDHRHSVSESNLEERLKLLRKKS